MTNFKFEVNWQNVWGGHLTQRFTNRISATLFLKQLEIDGIKSELVEIN